MDGVIMIEQWKDIDRFDNYQISNFGRTKRAAWPQGYLPYC